MAGQSAGGSRFYRYNAPRRYANTGSDVERGMQAGEQIGKLLGNLGTAITGAQKQARANEVANQLMNAPATAQANAQAAADPDPDPNPDGTDNLNPTAATDPSGTQDPTPFTGGVAEMQQRQAFQKDQLDTQIKQAQLADYLAEAQGTGRYAKRALPVKTGVNVGQGSSSRWLSGQDGQTGQIGQTERQTGTGRQPAYQPNSGDIQNDEGTDNFSQIATDFDNTYNGGQKGLYAKFAGNLPNLTPDDKGNFSLMGKDDQPVATIPASDAPTWIQRTNAARIKSGLSAIGSVGGQSTLGAGQHPTSSAAAGTVGNPVVAQSTLHVRSLPYGTYVYDPNTNQTFQKQKPAGQ